MATATPTPVPHPAHTANRQIKALRVVEWMESNPQVFGGLLTPDAVAEFGPEVWALVNTCMGEPRKMDASTISMIVGMLTVRGL